MKPFSDITRNELFERYGGLLTAIQDTKTDMHRCADPYAHMALDLYLDSAIKRLGERLLEDLAERKEVA